ncbi:hypothetical protein BDV95DRAFT_481015 [Massariosphaeria phaeospora]|uniref:5-formyltetrahydrofolate cyclo-ligase n=1 Tax=Massariosphaeria phaeospora TaxID=100035 RepID=A0A7C8MFL6_9PLEO|nr:hypothetical protein BDV95DRAFT_481015 [Massariosphaeria phaeospora]
MPTHAASSTERRHVVWARVYPDLVQHAIPDARLHYDFMSFTPDFRRSSYATDRLVELPCYKAAVTLLVTPDNSLEGLRHRALRDGKKLLVATHRLRRGFVLLDPRYIDEDRYETASWLDGMERPGVGQPVSLAKIQQDGITVDMCAIGGLAFNQQGVVLWEGSAFFEVQWAMLYDIKALARETPVAALVHGCQVVNEEEFALQRFKPDQTAEVQCDFVVTPERVIQVANAVKPSSGIDLEKLDQDALNNIPPLQELKGIRMMEDIMHSSGFLQDKGMPNDLPPSADELMGIDMVAKLMRGYKAC